MRQLISISILIILAVNGFSQSLSGTVINEAGEPLPSALVKNQQTGECVYTGSEGHFTIGWMAGQTITVSCMGYLMKKDIQPASQECTVVLKRSTGRVHGFIGYTGLLKAPLGIAVGAFFRQQFGLYISYRSTRLFQNAPGADGLLNTEGAVEISGRSVDFSNVSFTGTEQTYRNSILTGVIFKLYKGLSGYAAFGIGNYTVYRRVAERSETTGEVLATYKIIDNIKSKGPFENEIGLMVRTRRFYASAGVNLISSGMLDGSFGAGLIF